MMRYFVRIRLAGGIRWKTVEGISASRVAHDVLTRLSPAVDAVMVCRADSVEDTFCDCNMEAEESRTYTREEVVKR